MTYSIRVTCYWGDEDDLNLVFLVGPYPDAASRDVDLRRLASLRGNRGDATFHPSNLDPAGADRRTTPERVAGIWVFDQLVRAFCGVEPVCPACAHDPARAAYPACRECSTESAAFAAEMTG